MKCFRHDPGTLCPQCGLDRRVKTPKEIIQPMLPWGGSELFDRILRALESSGYKIMQSDSFVKTIDAETFSSVDRHTPTPVSV